MTILSPPSPLDKIIIVDFNDSFTYNIASIVYPEQKSCIVIGHRDFFESYYPRLKSSQGRHAIILGPGPGHPKEYKTYFSVIEALLKNEFIYVMGICLGHQILGMVKGLEIREVTNKVHGETVKITYQGQNFLVQRYNSLGVFEDGLEKSIAHFERGVSYQFHPESIGTDNNLYFFQDLLTFLRLDC